MNNWRRSVVVGALVIALMAVTGVTYLVAQSIDADKEAYLRSQTGNVAAKPTASSQDPFETDFRLAVGQKQTAFAAGLFVMPIMNSELTDTPSDRGWRGGGRSVVPGMSVPSYTVPAGGFDSPLWASAFGILAYLPTSAAAGGGFAEGSIVGTSNVYRSPPHTPTELPTGFWSDLGGIGSPGLAAGTTGPGGYREPFITEAVWYNNVGIDTKRQSYSFSYGYNHTNDFILYRVVLNVTGDVDVQRDGTFEELGVPVENFVILTNYDFDIPTALDPLSTQISENRGGDDKTPTGFFVETVPRATPEGLLHSGRYNTAPYGPDGTFYGGMSMMMDEEDSGVSGFDNYVWSLLRFNFNPLHLGMASLMVLEGDGTDATYGDLLAPAQTTIWGSPSIGMFHMHGWWTGDLAGVFNTYAMTFSQYLTSYPGDTSVGSVIQAQPQDLNPNPDFFTGGTALTSSVDISTWTPKAAVATLTPVWGDPRNLTQTGNLAAQSWPGQAARVPGQYDNITLFDMGRSQIKEIMPNPYNGADRKEITSTTGCDRNALGWGPYTLSPGQSLTIWQVDHVGAGIDGSYDVYQRALDVWMQRKYNSANDTYYWDGSNDRIIPTYDAAGNITGNTTVNLGRGVNSGAVLFPPPAPTLSVIPTADGTIMLAWATNAETAIDPGTGTADFSKYRVYRASGFIDQFPGETVAHPIGYNSTQIPPNLGLTAGSTPITDTTDPTATALQGTHPYARFIQEGNVIGADYLIGGVYSFITSKVSSFATPGFSGPYVQLGEFPIGGGANQLVAQLPDKVTVPNPSDEDQRSGFSTPAFQGETIETTPNAKQVVDVNVANKALRSDVGDAAIAVTFPADRFAATPFASVEDLKVDPRLAGLNGYMWEDTFVLIGFSYYYYVAAVDNESVVQNDFQNVHISPTGQTNIARQIDGLESFYTMNANGTDGRWHGTFPYRGRAVGPQVPGQDVIPTTIPRNVVTSGVPEFFDLVTVAPNPFEFQALWDLASEGQSVKFFNLPIPCRLSIFDVAGLLVNQFDVPSDKTVTVGGVTSWNMKNKSNVLVSGGLYICVIEAELGGKIFSKTLKLYVRR